MFKLSILFENIDNYSYILENTLRYKVLKINIYKIIETLFYRYNDWSA
ncbi:hypothetical protein BCBMB205_36770 [Bacillus sp. CN2]|nr:hypothetical protein BCBMB205_36770 [Bacillus velezensis]ARZ60022.1 hypothetical protein BAGQ_3818 [Bacillus velezensis]GFR55097.1 hypothetical protein BCBMB205_36770 [Bacillus sp. CN2]